MIPLVPHEIDVGDEQDLARASERFAELHPGRRDHDREVRERANRDDHRRSRYEVVRTGTKSSEARQTGGKTESSRMQASACTGAPLLIIVTWTSKNGSSSCPQPTPPGPGQADMQGSQNAPSHCLRNGHAREHSSPVLPVQEVLNRATRMPATGVVQNVGRSVACDRSRCTAALGCALCRRKASVSLGLRHRDKRSWLLIATPPTTCWSSALASPAY